MSAKIVIISDIHANYVALEKLKDAIESADHVICLGDIVGYYCQVNEVLDYIRSRPIRCILGNHDAYVLQGCPETVPDAVRFGIEYANSVIEPSHKRWLAELPLVWGGDVGGLSVLLSHGSPFRPLTDYLYENRIDNVPLHLFDFDLIAFGQTHRPLRRGDGRPRLLNPGSVGQSRSKPCVVSAAQVSADDCSVEFLEYAYDPSEVIDLAKRNGAGDWIISHLVRAE